LCALIGKEIAAVNTFLTLNLRIKLGKKVSEDGKHESIHVEMFKQWTDHTETIARKFEEIDEEKKKWEEIIAKLENKKERQ
jgi:hypothetical protein